jgi:hypothetical protein
LTSEVANSEADSGDTSYPRSTQRYPHPRSVYRTSWGNAWFVQLQVAGERHYSGTFATMEEAVEYRDAYLTHLRERAASTDASPQPR